MRGTSILTFHADLSNSGVNPTETTLMPTNVNTASFGKRYSTTVDGKIYAEPLYMPGVNVVSGPNAGVHNLCFVATQHDSLFAIDAQSGQVVWQTSFTASNLALPNATAITTVPSADVDSSDTSPEIGICSTPVIDPTTNYIYVAAKTKQIINGDASNPHYVYTLYQVDITNGNPTANANIVASTTIGNTVYNSGTGSYTYNTAADPTAPQDPFVLGTGDGAITVNGQSRVYFNALRQMNRPALRLYNGAVYLAFGSHGDNGPYHGWLLAYNAATLALQGVFNSSPNSGEGGFWGGGGGPVVDANGYIYIMSANGTFDGYNKNGVTAGLNSLGFPASGDYGDSFLKIAVDSTTSVGNQNINGWGLTVVDYFSPFNSATLDTTDTDLGSGGICLLPASAGSSAHPNLMVGAGKQGNIYLLDCNNLGKFSATTDNVVQEQAAIGQCFGTPCFFNGVLYYAGVTDNLKAFPISNAVMSTKPIASADTFYWPGATLTISANGTTGGIVWGVDTNSGNLRAYDASKVGTELWNSSYAANNADQLGAAQKFAAATVADGLVFVPTQTALYVYGPPQVATAAPAAPTGLAAAAVSGLQVNLTWTNNATNETGFAIEQSPDGVNFTQVGTVGTNVTTYSAETNIVAGLTYYFRVRAFNGTTTTLYSGYSNVVSVTTPGPAASLDFSTGFANSSGTLTFNGNSTLVNGRLRLTDGGADEVSSVFSTQPQNINRFTTTFTFQETAAVAEGFTFIIQNAGNTTVGEGGDGLGYGGIGNSVAIKFDIFNDAGEGSDSTGIFTNGADPTTPAVDLTSTPITLGSGDLISVTLTYDGTTLTETITDTVTGGTYTTSYPINLAATVGSSTAYIGFGGSTGSSTATQDIVTWTYVPLPSMAPTAPTNLIATPTSGTVADLSWTSNSNGTESGFIVMRATGSGSFTQVGVTGSGVTTYVDSALVPNTTYTYEVAATNFAGTSSYAVAAPVLMPTPPLTPTGAHATATTSSSISMAWTNNATNAEGYHILRAVGSATNFSLIATLPASATSFTDTLNLLAGTSYSYHIQCFNVAGYSDFSGFVTSTLPVTQVTPVVTSPPIGLLTGVASAIKPTMATLAAAVNPNGGDTTVSFQYGATISYGGSTATLDVGAGTTTATFTLAATGLAPSTTYHYRAVASSSGGTVYGTDHTFRTTAQQSIGATPLVSVSGAETDIAYAVNDGGIATTAYIQYGTTTSYGTQTASTYLGVGTTSTTRVVSLPNLAPGTTYHYRIVTVSATGTVMSDDQTFTTPAFASTLVAAPGDLLPVSTGTTASVSTLGNPAINTSGTCAFRAVLALGKGITALNNVGIWTVDSTGSAQLAVQTGTVNAPGVASPLRTILDPVFNDNNAIAFIGTVQSGVAGITPSTAYGIWSNTTGTLSLVARLGTQAPDLPAGVTFATFTDLALPDVGGPIILATLTPRATAGVTAANNIGIWAVDGSNNLHLVMRTGEVLNGKTVAALNFLPSPATASGQSRSFSATTGEITFLATFTDHTTAIYNTQLGTTPAFVAATGMGAPAPQAATFATFNPPAINSAGNNAYLATLTLSRTITALNHIGIWADDSTGALQLVAQTGSTNAPGTTAPFATLSDPVYNDNSSVAFVGTLKVGTGFATLANRTGVWSNVSGSLTLVAQSGTQAPGLPSGATFAGFSQIVLPDSPGIVMLATLNPNAAADVTAANSTGIWATDSTGNLQLVVRTGDMLDGKVVTSLSFLPSIQFLGGQGRGVGTGASELTYLVTFSGGSQAIYSASLP